MADLLQYFFLALAVVAGCGTAALTVMSVIVRMAQPTPTGEGFLIEEHPLLILGAGSTITLFAYLLSFV